MRATQTKQFVSQSHNTLAVRVEALTRLPRLIGAGVCGTEGLLQTATFGQPIR